MKVIIGSRAANESMPAHICYLAVEGLREAGVESWNEKVDVLGYAFLENSDDTRNTPLRSFIENLQAQGIREISIHDPFVRTEELPAVEREVCEALADTNCACRVTCHRENNQLDPATTPSGNAPPRTGGRQERTLPLRGESGFLVKTDGGG